MERVAICDDNPQSVQILREQIKEFARKMNTDVSITEYPNGSNLIFQWENPKLQTDILYLNMHMPGADGITVAEKLREDGCNAEIIFYTNSSSEVFAAFDVAAFHYILKDEMSIEKQEEIFRRAVARAHKIGEEIVTFACGGEHRTIKRGEIKYFTAELRVLTVHYEQDKTFDFYSNLSKMNNVLANEGFLRINKSTLINMAFVESRTGVDVIMKDGLRLPIGKKYRANAEEEFEYFFSD